MCLGIGGCGTVEKAPLECLEKKVEFSEVHRSNLRPLASVLWTRTGPRHNFFSISSTVATIVTRIRYKWL